MTDLYRCKHHCHCLTLSRHHHHHSTVEPRWSMISIDHTYKLLKILLTVVQLILTKVPVVLVPNCVHVNDYFLQISLDPTYSNLHYVEFCIL